MSEEFFLKVRVLPRASRDEVAGWQADVLRVRLRAPPLEGRANEALLRLLAGQLGLRPGDIEMVSGGSARTKLLRLAGVTEDEVRRRLG